MLPASVRTSAEEFQLREALAQRHGIGRDSIILFQETGLFLAELFKSFNSPQLRVIAAAPVIADIALAADHANAELVNCVSSEPFAGDIDSLRNNIKSITDIIYLANPNRLTGASYSNSQLKTMASLVQQGMLIVDEYYHDFFRLSALPLVSKYQNLIVLRVFEDWTRAAHSDCGYAVINEKLLEKIEFNSNSYRLERGSAKKCLEIIDNKKSCDTRIGLIQKRALQVAKELCGCGIKSQLAPADYILLELTNAAEIQEYLNSCGIRVERVSQDGLLQNYLRFQITGSDQDNKIIEAFSRIPASLLYSQAEHIRTSGAFAGSGKEKAKSALR